MRRALFLGLWLMLFLLRFDYLQGQNYTMTNGRVTTCSGNFYDPGGPDEDYGENLDFTQTFTAASPNMCLKVTFTSFHLESGYISDYYIYYWDYLEIYDGNSDSASLIGLYFGSNSPGSVTSTSGSLTFVFHSDALYNYSGWEATISCVECPDPENNMHDGTVIVDCSKSIVPFYDPGGPSGDYGSFSDFTQTFMSSDPDSCLEVTFDTIDLETRWDVLYVYDGTSDTTGTLLRAFSSSYSNVTLTSFTGALTFKFTSDYDGQRAGWEASIRCSSCAESPPSPPPPPAPNPCEPNGIHPFCTDANPYGIIYTSGTSGNASSFLHSSSYSCLSTMPNPAWYYMQISDPGDLLIYIEQTTLSGDGLDVDFACWGPFTASSQSDFVDKLCSGSYTLNDSIGDYFMGHRPENGNHQNDMGGYPVGNVVDCSYSIAATEWCFIPNAQPGEWYLLLITNYRGYSGQITFGLVEEYSTASTNCSLLAPISYNAPLCEGDTLVLTCENPQADATYHWSGPGGWTAVTTIPYVVIPNASTSQSGQYTLLMTGVSATVDTSQVDVVIRQRPQVTVTASVDSICNGSSVTLQAAGADTYRWLSTSSVSGSLTVTPDSSTTYTVIGSTGVCLDTAAHLVTVFHSSTGDTIAVACDRFDWYEHEGIEESGDYYHTFTNAAGCDSVVTLHLTIGNTPEFNVSVSHIALCAGDTVTLVVETYDDSSPVSYRWSNEETTAVITVSPDETTEYSVTVTNSYGCSDSESLTILVGTNSSQTFYDTICQGAGYDDNGFTLTEEETNSPGNYNLSYVETNNGCVSTITLHLTVLEPPVTIIDTAACDSFEWNDSIYYESRVDIRHFQCVNGCDSTVKLILTVGHTPEIAISVSTDTICRGDFVMLTAEVGNNTSSGLSYHWNTGQTTRYLFEILEETTQYAVTVTDQVGCSDSAVREVEIFKTKPMTDTVYRCCDSSAVMTARDAFAYLWESGASTQTVTVPSSGFYLVRVTPFYGCPVVDTVKVVTMLVNPFSEIHIPEMCGGGSYQVTVSHDSIADMVIRTHETSVALHDTMFIPGGDTCETNDCHHRSLLQLGIYEDTAYVNSVDDIRYVRVNMEHSYAGDLYIKLTCPNGQSADILRYGNPLQYEDRGDCWNEIPLSSFEWQTGDTNANLSTYFGLPIDRISSEYPCDSTDSDNAPGVGWNYCWSNNTSEGYTYAGGVGSLVYRNENVIIPADIYLFHYVFDSTHVTAGTQFYHPDESFESLVGCPLNGTWTLEVMDGNTRDNGYVFGWELALAENFPTFEYVDVDYITVDGPWVEVTDSTFLFSPPIDLERDTTISYTFHSFSEQGCHYDTTVEITFNARNIHTVNETACDSLVWNGVIYTKDTTITVTFSNIHGCDSIVTLNLNIRQKHPVGVSGIRPVCDGDSIELAVDSAAIYQWSTGDETRTVTISDSGTYSVRTIDEYGCYSDTTFYIPMIFPQYSRKDTLVCDSLVWEGVVYRETGEYTFSYPGSNGCDSVFLLNLVVSENPIVTAFLSDMVAGEVQVVTFGMTPEDNLQYINPQTIPSHSDTVFLSDGVPCEPYGNAQDDFVGPWSDRQTDTSFLITSPSDLANDTTVTYRFVMETDCGCRYDTTVDIHIYAHKHIDLYDTISALELDYTWNDSLFTGPGIKTIVSQTSHGADSVVMMHLSVIYAYDTVICNNKLPLIWHNRLFQGTDSVVTHFPVNGADSIEVLAVTVNDTTHGFKRISILENELPDFSLNGYTYDSAGTYTQILTNMAGCDSLLTIELVVLHNVDAQQDSSVCDNAFPFFWNGVRFDEPGSQTVILEASSGADSILLMNVEPLPHPTATISGMPVICNGDPALLTANEAFAYQWSNGDTTRSVAATTTGRWRLTVTDVNGCQDTTSVKVIATEMYKIDSIVLPRICAGDDYIFTVGHQSTSNIIIGNNETSLSRTETIFLPDGVDCPPYGCSYVSPLTFSAFPDDATVTSVNDILYVRLNMEHSYAADLYINIRCPNEQKADILRFNGFANSDCSSTIPYSSRSWQPGSNARDYTYFGWPYDNESDFSPCDADNPANAPGTGWNYCWSNNDAYSYGGGNGSLIYRSNNVRSYGSYFLPIYVFDSSNVALGTQFYHPDQSFSNLIGCPLNGTWKIEVMDGYEEDNGYVFGWELALSPHITTIENTDVTHVTVEGEWIEPLNDTTFLISPPATLTRDTTVQFLYHLFDDYGCSYDTLLSVMIFATDTVVMDTVVCDSFTWNNVTYAESGSYSLQFSNIHGCDSIVTINLTVVPSPHVTITGPVLLCADSVATLSAGDYAHYMWSTGDTTRTIDIGGSGTYSVTVTDEYGCSGPASHQVTSPVYPIVSVSRIGICADSTYAVTIGLSAENTVTLNQDPNLFAMDVQGIWIYDDEEGVPTVIPPANFPKDTTIRVAFSLADTNGCHYDTTLIVDVYHLIYKTIDSTVCDSLVFDGITYTQSGVSQHNFRTVNGCDSIVMLNLTVNYSAETYDTLYLVHNQLPYYFEPADIYFITPDDMSFQYLLQTQGGCDSVIQQQVYIYSNIVEGKDTTICSTALPFTWNGHVFESAGSVTDTLRTIHNSDSLVTYTLTVDEVDAAIGNVSHVVCYGDASGAAAATVTGGQDPMAYQWKDDGGNSVSTTTQIHDVMAGFYSFSVTDHLGCIASDTLTIRNLHEEIMPSTIAADQSVCEGDTLSRFTGSPASGGDEGVYQWQISSDGDVWATAPGISNQQNYTYPGIPQVSSFQLRRAWITASCGRAYSDTVEVEVWPAYHDTLSVTMCQGDTYQENGFEVDETMTANPGTFTLEQRLTTGHCDSVIILQYTVNQKYESTIEEEICEGKDYAAHGFVIPAEETVDVETLTRTLTLASVQGCDSLVQLHLTVVDTALQIVSLTPDFCEDMLAELVVVTELADYQWNTGETMSQITVTMPGVYCVTASQGNCRVQARYTIEPCEFKLFLPNAITPTRGDGLNDYFSIPETMQHTIGDFEITFYNRWGEIVFYSTDKSFRWNGEVNGTIYPNNVYSYIVRCTDVNGKQYTFKGTLTVL